MSVKPRRACTRAESAETPSLPGPARGLVMVLLAALASLFTMTSTASAQANAVIQRGDAVVTGFAGTVAPAEPPADVHPLDRTFIDLKGLTAQIFDLSNLGGGPNGQLADAPVRFKATAGDIGHVFGIAFEGDGSSAPPNIYLAASALHGLQIVKQEAGQPRRLVNGEPGARFMNGQFGPGRGGPGSIYRIDGRTGEITLFANVVYDGRGNSGPGLGNLAYDARSRQLFATDLETGMIHRFTMDGRDRDTFDHGVDGRRRAGLAPVPFDPAGRVGIENPAFNAEDTATWGFTPPARMIFGLAVQGRRLYYTVAEGPQIWSVGIDDEGDFGDDARLEIDVKDTPAGNVVTSIQFDAAGMMYLAQRGEFSGSYDYQLFAKPQASVVLRYQWDQTQRRWSDVPDEYAVGLPPEHRATVGGVALNYGYDRNGRINYGACRQTVWTTGEHLREGEDVKRVSTGGPSVVHGLQGHYKSKVRPANEPPYEAWFTDYDGRFEDAEVNGHIGNVAIYNICEGVERAEAIEIPVPVVIPGEPDLVLEKHCFVTPYGGRVRCLITVRNVGGGVPIEDIVLIEDTRILHGPHAGRPVVVAEFREDRPGWICTAAGGPEFSCRLSGRDLGPGQSRTIEVWIDTRVILIDGNYGFRNCVILRHPNGQRRVCDEGGTDIVVEKTGPAICQPGGKCRYGLTIRNAGDEPFSGEVLLNDHMTSGGNPFAGQITAISQPLGCTPEPTQVPFTCLANVSLTAGESRTIWIDVQLPPGQGGYVIENCFWITDPIVTTNDNLRNRLVRLVREDRKPGRHFMACVRTRVPWPEKPVDVPFFVPPGGGGFLPPDPVCWNGQIPLPGGRCACPGNTRWDPELGACRQPPRQTCYDPARTMPNGQCCPWGSRWDSESWSCRRPPPPTCFDPARRMPSGACCPPGSRWDWESRSCKTRDTVCPGGRPPLPNGLCGCPPGTRWDPATRHCGRPGDQTDGRCPDGLPKLWGGICKCPDNMTWNAALQRCVGRIVDPICRGGAVWNPQTKRCEPKLNEPKCPLNQPYYNPITKRCERRPPQDTSCPSGQVRIGDRCVPSKGPVTCPTGQHKVGEQCVPDRPTTCPPGQHRVGDQCVPDRPTTCPPGQHKVGTQCVPDRPTTCPPGQHKVGTQCVPDRPTTCPPGQHKVGDACVPDVKPGDCKPGFVKTQSGACLPKSVVERCPPGQFKQADGSCKAPLKVDPKSVPKKVDTKSPPKIERPPVLKKSVPKVEKRPLPKKIEQRPPTKKVDVKKVPVPKRAPPPDNTKKKQ